MALEVIDDAPSSTSFTALDEHQTQTPGTFFGGKPVLHLHCPKSRLRLSYGDLVSQKAFANLNAGDAPESNGADDYEIPGVDVWVTSRSLTLWSANSSKGLQISYPTITVHAQENDAVLLELSLSDSNVVADEDLEFMQLRIIPGHIDHAQSDAAEHTTNGDGPKPPAYLLYKAIGDCQELNPDPQGAQGDDNDEFDTTAPGSTGWITSENMQDFMDENGDIQFLSGTHVTIDDNMDGTEEAIPLGHGAGRTRNADEIDDSEDAEDETKWQRTA